eukprot:g800.t1
MSASSASASKKRGRASLGRDSAPYAYQRRRNRIVEDEKDDGVPRVKMDVVALGAGKQVGKSCHLLQYPDGKTIMLDCGTMPGKQGMNALPSFSGDDGVDLSTIEICLVTHFHLDHIAALPWLMRKSVFKGQVYMTLATMAISRLMLTDFVRRQPPGQELYTADDVLRCMQDIQIVEFHQEKCVAGVKFTAYHAGHVLGAAMFAVEYNGIKTLYTGDFSRLKDRHLIPAEIPPFNPDVLIIESTCGKKKIEEKRDRESELTKFVVETLEKGGRCLLPMFAQGRAQEIMLILEEYWESNPRMQRYPIVVIGNMASKSLYVFRTYTNQMNRRIREARSPFDFKHIRIISRIQELDDQRPCVVMANPGFLESGNSRRLLERWCESSINGVALCGYSVQGTLAYDLAFNPKQTTMITSQFEPGRKLHRRCATKHVSFMAHSDFKDTSRFIRDLMPSNVILVHGAPKEVEDLQLALVKQHKPRYRKGLFNCYAPDTRNNKTTRIRLSFKKIKRADVIGSAAKRLRGGATESSGIDGVLVSRDFEVQIMDPQDIPTYTSLDTTDIFQRLHVPFHCTFEVLCDLLRRVFDDVREISSSSSSSVSKEVSIQDAINVTHDASKFSIQLRWTSSPMHDMLADSIVALVMELQMSHVRPPKVELVAKTPDRDVVWNEVVGNALRDQFGEDRVTYDEHRRAYSVSVESREKEAENDRQLSIIVAIGTGQSCELQLIGECTESLRRRLELELIAPMNTRLSRLRLAKFPLKFSAE